MSPFCRADSCGALREHLVHREPYGQKRSWQTGSVHGGSMSMTSHRFVAEPLPEDEPAPSLEEIAREWLEAGEDEGGTWYAVARLVPLLQEMEARGQKSEREAVVRWLRDETSPGGHRAWKLSNLIERGDHVR